MTSERLEASRHALAPCFCQAMDMARGMQRRNDVWASGAAPWRTRA
jgi:hypothetical protein